MIADCFVFGVNHHSTETEIRGQFSLSQENRERIYNSSLHTDIQSLAILNTCNRTEIMGIGNKEQAIELYLSINQLEPQFKQQLFVKNGKQAIEHIFTVASGLDSKVIGDLEILGQVKDAFHQSKRYGLLNGYLERMANHCVQAAKEVRNNTRISDGTTSLAYSVVKFFKEAPIQPNPRVLLIGAGSFAKHIAQDISDYMRAELVVTNRTDSKAENFAEQFGIQNIPFAEWQSRLSEFDIVISAVSAPDAYLIDEHHLGAVSNTYLLDMSVPYSINPSIKTLLGNKHLTIDELSQLVNNTIESRKADIPVAKTIIDKHLETFYDWSLFNQNSASIKEWKSSLYAKVEQCPFLKKLPEKTVNKYVSKSVSQFVLYIKKHNQSPQDTTAMLNDFLAIYHEAEIANFSAQRPSFS